jgi:hypothetical protein
VSYVHTYAAPLNLPIPDGKSAEGAVADALKQLYQRAKKNFEDRADPTANYEDGSIQMLLVHHDTDERETHYSMSITLQVSAVADKAVTVLPRISIEAEVRHAGSQLRWVPPDPDLRVNKLLEDLTNVLG